MVTIKHLPLIAGNAQNDGSAVRVEPLRTQSLAGRGRPCAHRPCALSRIRGCVQCLLLKQPIVVMKRVTFELCCHLIEVSRRRLMQLDGFAFPRHGVLQRRLRPVTGPGRRHA